MYRVRLGILGQVPQPLTWAWHTSTSATTSRRTGRTNQRQNEQPQGGRRKIRRRLGVVCLVSLGTRLEHQFHGELQLSRVLRALNHIEVRVPEDAARKIQVGMIQRVENIEPELHS